MTSKTNGLKKDSLVILGKMIGGEVTQFDPTQFRTSSISRVTFHHHKIKQDPESSINHIMNILLLSIILVCSTPIYAVGSSITSQDPSIQYLNKDLPVCLMNVLQLTVQEKVKIWDEDSDQWASIAMNSDENAYDKIMVEGYQKLLDCFDYQAFINVEQNGREGDEKNKNELLGVNCLEKGSEQACGLVGQIMSVLAHAKENEGVRNREGRVKERIVRAEKRVHVKYSDDDKIAITFDKEGKLLKGTRDIITKVLNVKGTGGWSSTLVINQLINKYLAKRVDGVIELDLRDKYTQLGIQLLPIDKSHTLILLLSQIDIIGLDTFCSIDLLKPVGKYTLQHKICLDYITVSISFQILDKRRPSKVKVFTLTMQLKDLDMSFSTLIAFDQLGILNFQVGWLSQTIKTMELIKCLLTTIADFGFLEFDIGKHAQLSMSLHSNPANAKEESIKEIANMDKFLQSVWKMNSMSVRYFIDSLDIMVSDIGYPLLSKYVTEQKKCSANALPFPPERTNGPFMKFKTNSLINILAYLFNEVIGTTGDASINKIMNALFDLKNGMLTIKDDIVQIDNASMLPTFPLLGSQPANITLKIGNVTIGPLDQFEKFSLIVPTSDNTLASAIAMKDISITADLQLKLVGMIQNEIQPMHNQVRITMNIGKQKGKVSTQFGMFMNVDTEPANHLSIKQLSSDCLSMLFPNHNSLGLNFMELDIGGLFVKMNCREFDGVKQCNTPMVQEIEQYVNDPLASKEINKLLHRFLPPFLKILTGDESAPELFGGFKVQTGIDNSINDYQKTCIQEPTPAPVGPPQKPEWIPSMRKTMAIGAALMALGFIATIAYAHLIHKNQRKRQLRRLSSTPEVIALVGTPIGENSIEESAESNFENHLLSPSSSTAAGSSNPNVLATPLLMIPLQRRLSLVQQRSPDGQTLLSDHDAIYIIGMDKPLIFHPSLRRITRYGVTFLLVLNFIVYVSGNFFTQGTMSISTTLTGERLRKVDMLTQTLDESIDMLVEGRAVLFAFYIGTASGMLPWMRVAMLLYCWVVPTTVLSPTHRHDMLRFLEKIGKWCYAQYYLYVILQASMNSHMDISKLLIFLPYNTLALYIESSPKWGLFTFIVATILSVLLNQYMILLHEHAMKENKTALDLHRNEDPGNYALDRGEQQMSDSNITISTGVGNIIPIATGRELQQPKQSVLGLIIDRKKSLFNTMREKGYNWQSLLLSFLLIAWVPMLGFAFVMHTYNFEFTGVSGLQNEYIGSGKNDKVSLAHLFSKLREVDGAEIMEPYEIDLMSICYLMFVLVFPVCLCIISLITWFIVPADSRLHPTFTWMLRSVRAWSGIEVFCCTVFIVVFQLHRFFKYLSTTTTYCPQNVGSWLASFGAAEDESMCFGVRASLMNGFYVTLIASLLSMICPTIILHFVSKSN